MAVTSGTLNLVAQQKSSEKSAPEPLNLELARIVKRANDHALRVESNSPDSIYISFPSGRAHRQMFVTAQEAERFSKYHFESWTILSDLNAIFDRERQEILSEVAVARGAFVDSSTLPGTKVETLEELDGLGQVQTLGSELRLVSDAMGLVCTLRVNHKYNSTALTFLLSNASIYPAYLRISGVKETRHDDVKKLLLDVATALFFDIDTKYDVPFQLVPHIRAGFEIVKRSTTAPIHFPSRRYPIDPVRLYLQAAELNKSESTQTTVFLTYYQVIEHFMPIHSSHDAIRRIKMTINSPSFDSDDDKEISRLVSIVSSTSRPQKELEQLKITLGRCCDEADLRDFISWQHESHTVIKDEIEDAAPPSITIRNQSSIIEVVAEHVYNLRCRIVHTKEDASGKPAEALLPFSKEAHYLQYEIGLIRYLAQRVLIAANMPLSS